MNAYLGQYLQLQRWKQLKYKAKSLSFRNKKMKTIMNTHEF
jgi:hypothetical protein